MTARAKKNTLDLASREDRLAMFLRQSADIIQEVAATDAEAYVFVSYDSVQFGLYTGDDLEKRMATVARVLKRYGIVKKEGGEGGMRLRLRLAPGLFIVCSAPGLCEKVQVGTKVVEATEEQVIPAQPEREEPVYEWKCPESILA